MQIPKIEAEAVKQFRKDLSGRLISADESDYESFREIWNAHVKSRPALIVMAEVPSDIVASVQFALRHHLPLSLRAGGHDWAGKSLNENGVLINMSRMKSIEIDADTNTALIGPGVTAIELALAAEEYQLVPVTGTVGSVGYAGLTLGGGYGPLLPSAGLASDNLLSVDIVLADGSYVTASRDINEDIYWAVCGGGGAFGAVTSLQVQLHRAKPLLAGMLLFNPENADKVLEGYNEIMKNAPDELAVYSGFMTGQDEQRLFYLIPVWHGDPNEGRHYVTKLEMLAPAILSQVGEMKYSEFLKLFDASILTGANYYLLTRWIKDFGPDERQAFINAAGQITSPYSMINVHHFHGEATRIASDSTAFGFREHHYMVEIISCWRGDDQQQRNHHTEWAHRFFDALGAFACPGGYANLLAADNDVQAKDAFGSNLASLQQIKRKTDPDNIFKGLNILSV